MCSAIRLTHCILLYRHTEALVQYSVLRVLYKLGVLQNLQDYSEYRTSTRDKSSMPFACASRLEPRFVPVTVDQRKISRTSASQRIGNRVVLNKSRPFELTVNNPGLVHSIGRNNKGHTSQGRMNGWRLILKEFVGNRLTALQRAKVIKSRSRR